MSGQTPSYRKYQGEAKKETLLTKDLMTKSVALLDVINNVPKNPSLEEKWQAEAAQAYESAWKSFTNLALSGGFVSEQRIKALGIDEYQKVATLDPQKFADGVKQLAADAEKVADANPTDEKMQTEYKSLAHGAAAIAEVLKNIDQLKAAKPPNLAKTVAFTAAGAFFGGIYVVGREALKGAGRGTSAGVEAWPLTVTIGAVCGLIYGLGVAPVKGAELAAQKFNPVMSKKALISKLLSDTIQKITNGVDPRDLKPIKEALNDAIKLDQSEQQNKPNRLQ